MKAYLKIHAVYQAREKSQVFFKSYLSEKNKSVVIATPIIRIKLIIFPIPKYLSNTNNVIEAAAMNPRLVLSRIIDSVNKDAVNSKIEKSKTIPGLFGSVK